MSQFMMTPVEELISIIDYLSDESKLSDSWFVTGAGSPEDDFNNLYDSPHIDWNELIPGISESVEFIELYNMLDLISGDKYKKNINDAFVDIDSVKIDSKWKEIPILAKKLKEFIMKNISN